MITIQGDTAPELYSEAWWSMRINSKEEQSRNGPVMAMQEPTELVLWDPRKRVLFDPLRDANPFFHVMEAVWMFSGSSDVGFLVPFNQTYRQYAEPDGTVWGAYGARWRSHFGPGWNNDNPMDQILATIRILRSDPTSRQAVIAMWDPASDLEAEVRDRPCNTHIYLRILNGRLDMTVCNRSNDMIWGALGANIVHMTYLQELIAAGVGIPVGVYRVLSNNFHVYKDREDVKRLWETSIPVDYYLQPEVKPYPLIQEGETVEGLLQDCEILVAGGIPHNTKWGYHVAWAIYKAYLDKENRALHIQVIEATDWRLACHQWMDRRKSEVSSSPSPTQSPAS